MKTVADIMTPAPIVVEVPGSRSDAINTMVRNKLTGLPVVRASDGMLMGVVSRRDIFRKFDEDQLSLIMKKGCITVSPDATVEEVARIFSEMRIHRLPVVDEGKLVGIITDRDLFSDQVKDPEALKELGISDDANLAGFRNVLPLFYSATDKYMEDDRTVKDFMVRNPTTVFKKTNLAEVAKMMVINDFGQIPVHGTKDELVGMVYDVDVLCALSGNLNE